MGTMEIPEAFANAFIALANDMNDHEDELDLGLSDNHTRLYLSNGCPRVLPVSQAHDHRRGRGGSGNLL